MTDQEIKKSFRAAIRAAVEDALGEIAAAISEKRFISEEYDWPSLTWNRENGMPNLGKNFSGPPSYSSVFQQQRILGTPQSDPSDHMPSFDQLQSLIFNDDFLRERLLVSGDTDRDTPFSISRFFARYLPKQIAARYVSVYQTTTFDENRFDSVFGAVQSATFEEDLGFDLWIPILFLNFTFDELRISEHARVVRMTDEFHLARSSVRAYGTGGHEQVLACATHALVLEGWIIENRNHMTLHQVFASQDTYPKEDVERFFGAIRTVTGLDTGYCQLLVVPNGWALTWKGSLPTVHGTSLRAYPGFFENFYWNKAKLPSLDVDLTSTCGLAFRRLKDAQENSLAIAIRRLNRCYCRDDEEDMLIDATIALEALLSDDESQEMTHKLALRVAAISQLIPNQTKSAQQVFIDIKTVYKLRSKIVHGRAPKDKDRVIGTTPQEHIATSEVARDHLRGVIRVLIDHSEFRCGKRVDQLLLSRVTAMHL